MGGLGRFVAAIAVLAIAAISVVAATDSPAAGKSAEVVTPQYVQGYWPDEPQLCIGDLTEGLPVAEAAAQFEATNVDMVMLGRCDDDAVDVAVFVVDDLVCDGSTDHDGCHFRGKDSFEDHDGLWVYSPGPYILLSARSDLTDQQWVAVITHELGHLVGLDHTNRRDSIMRPDSTGTGAGDDGHDGLTTTDIGVINSIYP